MLTLARLSELKGSDTRNLRPIIMFLEDDGEEEEAEAAERKGVRGDQN